jgi:hypothetical protein
MRRALIFILTGILIQSAFAGPPAQKDRLEGRWAGTVDGLQGKQDAVANFKKEGDKYTGSISGMRPGMSAPLKDIKLDGDKVTAKTELETPQGSITINYSFVLQAETMKGKGEAEFGGQTFGFDFDLKRTGDAQAAAAPDAAPARPQRRDVPQPQQKQSLDYFVGQWSFDWIGRESPLGPGPREGITTFTRNADGTSLTFRTEGKADGKPYSETGSVTFDEATKMLTFTQRLGNGIQIQSKGDWRSPISIRFTVDPIKVKNQTLMLRRMISVVAAHSFTVAEELSEDGGPFVRLGSAVYSKMEAK